MKLKPIALFDKSFLQSLSLDESVWFNHFFYGNICPLFYVETLADLNKHFINGNRDPEKEVRKIANKFPEQGQPNANHAQLALASLLGKTIVMDGAIHLPYGQLVQVGQQISAIYETSPEADAFHRWVEGDFFELERRYAKMWRERTSKLDLKLFASVPVMGSVDIESCKTLQDAKTISENFVSSKENARTCIDLILIYLDIPTRAEDVVLQPWRDAGSKPLTEFAPYAAYLLTVEIFFNIALTKSFISAERPSNRIDIAYLFYLPFCDVFVSSDGLHERCAPLFLRENQTFVRGEELKQGLKQLNELYAQLPEETKEEGIINFAADPPKSSDCIVTTLWDRHVPGWRERRTFSPEIRSEVESYMKNVVKQTFDARKKQTSSVPTLDSENVDHFMLQSTVRAKKGSWWQVPKSALDELARRRSDLKPGDD